MGFNFTALSLVFCHRLPAAETVATVITTHRWRNLFIQSFVFQSTTCLHRRGFPWTVNHVWGRRRWRWSVITRGPSSRHGLNGPSVRQGVNEPIAAPEREEKALTVQSSSSAAILILVISLINRECPLFTMLAVGASSSVPVTSALIPIGF